MRRICILAGIIIVVFAVFAMFNPKMAPSLDSVLPRLAALPDGSGYYFAENRAYGSYLIGSDSEGNILSVRREGAIAAGLTSVVRDIVWWDGGLWFALDISNPATGESGREIRRMDAFTGVVDTVFTRVTGGAGPDIRLSADGEHLYMTLRSTNGAEASAYELPCSRDEESGKFSSDDPVFLLVANAGGDGRILSAVSDGRYLYCAMSDANVRAFSAGGAKVISAETMPLGLSSAGGGLFFTDASSNTVYFDKDGLSYQKELPAQTGQVLAGAALDGMGFAVLASQPDGKTGITEYDGVNFAGPVSFAFNPAANIRISLSAVATPLGAAALALVCLVFLLGTCILAKTVFARIISLQCFLVLLVATFAVGTGYLLELSDSADREPDAAFLAALRAEERGERDGSSSSDAAVSEYAALRGRLEGCSETLLSLQNNSLTIAESYDLPVGLPAGSSLSPYAASLALAAAETGEPQSGTGTVRGRTSLLAAAPLDDDGGSRILLLSFDTTQVERAVLYAFRSLLLFCAAAGLGVLLVCVLLTALWMRPLLILPGQIGDIAANRILDGGIRFAFGEAGRIQEAVQEAFLSLSIREYEMTVAMKNYRRFMPQDLDMLLDRANLMEIEYGDIAQGENDIGMVTTVMNGSKRFGADQRLFLDFVFSAFHGIYSAADGKASFLSNGFSLTDFRLLFRGGSADGVRMGIRLATDAVESPHGVPSPEFLLILHRAGYEYGVTGQDAQAVTFMSSYELGLLAKFSMRLSSLGVKLIVTEKYAKNLAEAVSTRYIGYVTSSDEQHSIKLYEVLDAYRESTKNLRKKYNDKFQEAIRLYYKSDFYLARNIFSEIFKNCPDDGVAKWYIFACERLFNRTDFSAINYSIFGTGGVRRQDLT